MKKHSALHWGSLAAVGLVVALAAALLLLGARGDELRLTATQATAVTRDAAGAVGASRLGETTAVAVAAGGALLISAPEGADADASVEVALANGTVVAGRLRSDPLSGIAAVDAVRESLTSLRIGTTETLQPGQELILAPGGGAAPLRVRYVGRGSVMLERYGLGQYVLDLALPAGAVVVQGVVLDAEGRLLAIVVPDRQQGVPAGRVFAVPVEQATDLLASLGVATPIPSVPPVAPGPFLTAGPRRP